MRKLLVCSWAKKVPTQRAMITAACLLGLRAAWGADAKGPEKPALPGTPVVELTLSAKAIERPLMKYRLLPTENELRDGNAAPILLRMPWEQTAYFAKVVPTFDDYLNEPLDSPKVRDADNVFTSGFYRVLKRAAYRKTADWQYPIGEEPAANILLPDVQSARGIVGRGLSVRIRNRISRGDLKEAREGILVGLAVSRQYGRTPFVVTQLICGVLDTMMLSRLEELISQPGCPNLYWALTALPRPLVDLRPAIELEQHFLEMTVPGIDDFDPSRTEAQWKQQAQKLSDYFLETVPSTVGRQPSGFTQKILGRMAKQGRAQLPQWVDGGAKRVAAMSDAEAGLRWFVHVHQEQSEENSAVMSLEPPAAIPRLEAIQKRLAKFRSELGLPNLVVLEKPLNIYLSVHAVERRVDALRVVEAIRNHAAGHESQLPKSLDKIVDAPLPNDPFTGKPFQYEVTDGVATLSAQGYREEDGKEHAGIRFRIKMRK